MRRAAPVDDQLILELPTDPVVLEAALQESFLKCPGLARRHTLASAMRQPPIRRCLEIMAEIRLRRLR